MRVLSILCGLSFAVMAGYFLACSLMLSLVQNPDLTPLGQGLAPLSWAVLALAALGALAALRSRCEGWAPLLTGCALFLLCQLVAAQFAGLNLSALLCIAAAGFALLPLTYTPASYWRVAG